MITTAFRLFAAIFVGVLVAVVLLIAVELFSAVVHPFPEGFGGTEEEMCRHVERYPPWVLAVVVPAWAGAAFLSTWVARRLGNIYTAVGVGLLLLGSLVLNIAMLPYPLWFKIASSLAIPIAMIAGCRPLNWRRQASEGLPG